MHIQHSSGIAHSAYAPLIEEIINYVMYSRKIKKGIDSRQLTVNRYEWPHFGDPMGTYVTD